MRSYPKQIDICNAATGLFVCTAGVFVILVLMDQSKTRGRNSAGMKSMQTEPLGELPSWTFLSNHAHVLLLIARDPEVKLRDVAARVGITERAVQRIVADLESANYLERTREGRRNRYSVHTNLPLRHPIEAHTEIGALLNLILNKTPGAKLPSRPVAKTKSSLRRG